jgi:hypothetical protein
MILPAHAIVQHARNAGFDETRAAVMACIALRESGGNPEVVNVGPKDNSFGLWQINMLSSQVAALVLKLGFNSEQLKDPAVNANVAFAMWGGNDKNLDVAWAWNKPIYKERWESHLPAVCRDVMASTQASK